MEEGLFKQAVTVDDFKTMVSEAGDKPIFVDFFATWCGKCQMLEPELEEIAKEYSSKAVFIKVDIEENEDTAMAFEIECLPAVLRLAGRNKVGEMKGSKVDKIKEWFAKQIEEIGQ